MLQDILFQINVVLSNFPFIKEWWIKVSWFPQKYYAVKKKSIFLIIRKVSWAQNQHFLNNHVKPKTGVMAAENSALPLRFKIY